LCLNLGSEKTKKKEEKRGSVPKKVIQVFNGLSDIPGLNFRKLLFVSKTAVGGGLRFFCGGKPIGRK